MLAGSVVTPQRQNYLSGGFSWASRILGSASILEHMIRMETKSLARLGW